MPIKIQSDLPVKEILEKENIFVMDEKRASHQDIRPIQILILNLMPLKEDTELQLLRSLSNTPLQVDVSFMMVATHEAKNTATSHLNKFYETFSEVKHRKFDGMIITGAPVEQMEFEEVDYWEELTQIMDWTKTNVTSTIYLCWGAQAGLYYHYGLKKRLMDKKVFGLFRHRVENRKIPLVRGFDDEFWAPLTIFNPSPARRELIISITPVLLLYTATLFSMTCTLHLSYGIKPLCLIHVYRILSMHIFCNIIIKIL